MNFSDYLLLEKVGDVSHKLSGVVLIYNNKILLVRPKKFKRRMRKWSIPKGHIEGKLSKMETALHELEEESRIKIKKKHLKSGQKTVIEYYKARANKILTCYVVKIEKEDMNVRLFNDMILGNFLKGETVEAGFFSKEDAVKIIERHQLKLLKFLD
jgi:ADP-ribose pyrophosphatase YjhB (NUDIX family)